MDNNAKYIRFDWAAKRILRDKANFSVLEGLITVLLDEKVTITELLESESNQEDESDKFNRVDVKALNSKGEIIIVEIQQSSEYDYLQRILFGVAKAITEHLHKGDEYEKVKKVYSINIIYFDLGKGSDYVYHGQTTFKGIHTGDTLQMTPDQAKALRMKSVEEVFPEYYIIRVNEFNKVATTPLEEWLDYLKNGRIKDSTRTPGLEEAKTKLLYMKMSEKERKAYDSHIDAVLSSRSMFKAARMEGKQEGREEGRKEGREEGRKEGREEGRKEGREEGRKEGRKEEKRHNIKQMLSYGLPAEKVSKILGISKEEIDNLLKDPQD